MRVDWGRIAFVSPKHETHNEGSELPAKLRKCVSVNVESYQIESHPIFEKPVPLSQMMGASCDIVVLRYPISVNGVLRTILFGLVWQRL